MTRKKLEEVSTELKAIITLIARSKDTPESENELSYLRQAFNNGLTRLRRLQRDIQGEIDRL